MSPEQLAQIGVSGSAFALILGLLWRGTLATRQEVEAWRQRTERAESQVDKLITSIDRLSDLIEKRNG